MIKKTMLRLFFMSVFFIFHGYVKSEGSSIIASNSSTEITNTTEQSVNEVDKKNDSIINDDKQNSRQEGFIGDNGKMHEVIYSGFQFNKTAGSCDDGRAYSSFANCTDDCERRKEKLIESIYPFAYPFTHKVMFLFSNEFSITSDNKLKVPSIKMNISNDSYVLYPNGTARACLPLIKDLESCDAWNVEPKLLEFHDNGNRMWHKVLRRYYNWNEFFFMEGYVIICEPKELERMTDISLALKIGNILSTICLCLGVILSRFITDLKKNILLQCHIIMLALAYVVATCRSFHPDTPPTVCIITSSLHQFLSLSAFLWVNIQSFDLLTALRKIRINKKMSLCRFLAYAAISWGIPGILTTFAVITEILEHPVLRPGFKIFCFFSYGTAVSFGYYFGWMGLSISVNLLLFILIVFQFRKKSQEVSMVNRDSQKQLFIVSIKLVFTMGFIWIFSVISWTHADEGIIIWCLNVTTSLQGVFVFLIYIFKIKYLKTMVEKFHKTSTKPRTSTRSATSIATSRSSLTSLSSEHETIKDQRYINNG